MSFAVSGASTLAASDDRAIAATSSALSASNIIFVTGLTPGTNTFTLQYRVTNSTLSFANRTIAVIPMP